MKKYAVCGDLPEPEAVNCVLDCLGGNSRYYIVKHSCQIPYQLQSVKLYLVLSGQTS